MITIHLDSSLLKETDCDAKVNFIHNKGLFTIHNHYKMAYGTAYHKFLKGYYQNKPFGETSLEAFQFYTSNCLQVPASDFRTIDHLIQAIPAYARYYPKNSDRLKAKTAIDKEGKTVYAVELPFAWPYYVDKNLGIEVILTGTIDFDGYEGNEEVFVDHKVTAIWDTEKFLDGFDLDPQPAFYSYCAKRMGLKTGFQPVIINAIFIKKPVEKPRKVPSDPAFQTSYTGVGFKRSPRIEFTDERMDKFEKFLEHRVERLVKDFKDNFWEENHTRCKTPYGACDFANICRAKDLYKEMIINSYQKRVYEPLKFQD